MGRSAKVRVQPTSAPDAADASDIPADAPKVATVSRGFRRGIVGHFLPKVSFEVPVISGAPIMAGGVEPHGIGFRPRKASVAAASLEVELATHSEPMLDRQYDWRRLPRWWQLSMWMCMFAYVACCLWDLATLGPHDPAYAAVQAFAAVFFTALTLLLHHLEGRWFARWHMARAASGSADGARKGSAQVASIGRWCDRQPIWLTTLAAAVIVAAIGGILLAEALVFTSTAAMENATTSGVFGYLPNVVAFNGSTIRGLAYSMFIFGIGYSFYHAVLPYCLFPTSELPPWLLPLLVWENLVRWAILMWRFMPIPGPIGMTGFGAGFVWPIHDCYRMIIRGVRLCGLPTMEGRYDYAGRLFMLGTLPYLYYIMFHSVPMVALKLAAGSYEFPRDDPHNFVPNPSMAILRWMDPDPSPNVTRTELTGIGMFEVLDFPIVPIWSCWILWAFSPILMAYLAARGVQAKTAWPSKRRVWPVQTIFSSLSAWVAPCALSLESLLRGVFLSAGVSKVFVTWIVFILGTEFNGLMAALMSALTEFGTDPRTFEPELPQVTLMVIAVVLSYKSLLPYTIDTFEFWLTLTLVKLGPIAVDTLPWRELRKVWRQPGAYPWLFYRNFPWEETRFCIVVTQVCDVMFTLILVVPLITIRQHSGVGVLGEPIGWIICNDEPVGELLARLAIILVASSAANAAHFFLVARACEHVSGRMAKHEHGPSSGALLPWPDGKLRTSSDILRGLGWRLVPCIAGAVLFNCYVFMRPSLAPERCDNYPNQTSGFDGFFGRQI